MRDIEPSLGIQRREPAAPSVNQVLADARTLFRAGKIKWSYHAGKERMPERGFDFFDVEAVVLGGYVPDGRVKPGRKNNEWVIKVVDKLEGSSRKVGVVCIVSNRCVLIIPTVEWEDR